MGSDSDRKETTSFSRRRSFPSWKQEISGVFSQQQTPSIGLRSHFVPDTVLKLVTQQGNPIAKCPCFDECEIRSLNVLEKWLPFSKHDRDKHESVFINQPEICQLLDDRATPENGD